MAKKFRNHQKKNEAIAQEVKLPSQNRKAKPFVLLLFKVLVMTGIVAGTILYLESEGYFNPDESNNHTKRKWDSLYKLSKKHNIDILLLGNSHLYTGINPHNLTAALGANAFILASPGTNISDSYYSLREALKITKPKVVVLETYGITDFNPYKLKGSSLSDQFKSFAARRDIMEKLTSTPFLFSSENYLYAWSNTIRNHDFIFKNMEQIEKNKRLKNKPLLYRDQVKTYLGRFILFNTGLTDTVITKYKTNGAPVDGTNWKSGSYVDTYLEKITELCRENNIELVFLTLPMYHEHVSNYGVWKENLGKVLSKYSTKWLDLQDPYDHSAFGPNCFENTYNENQHLTYEGSIAATYKLEDYLRKEYLGQLPDRKKDKEWMEAFYAEEGYFENNPPLLSDNVNKILAKDMRVGNYQVKEVDLVVRNPNKAVIAKVDKPKGQQVNFDGQSLRLLVRFKNGNLSYLDLPYNTLYKPSSHAVFLQYFSSIEDFEVISGNLMN